METSKSLPPYQIELLVSSLRQIFGEFDDAMLKTVAPLLEWVELAGGQTLMREGDAGDDLHFVISGRLRAYVRNEAGEQTLIGEIIRGQTIGEMALFTQEPRSATVITIRDSVLVRMTRPIFEQLLSVYPLLSLSMTRLIIQRLKHTKLPRCSHGRPVNICLLPISAGIDPHAFGARLVNALSRHETTMLVTSAAIGAMLDDPAIAQANRSQLQRYRRLTQTLDELESRHGALVFVPDADPDSEWTRRCIRYADEVLLLADAAAAPAIHPHEARYLTKEGKLTGARQVLVLLHRHDKTIPTDTHRWLDRRPLAGHIHIRPDLVRDLERLARIESGRAIGLVLCGGGARGFAHLGVYKALHEFGIDIDYVGGTSIGAVMGAFAAFDMAPDLVIARARKAFRLNPTSDYNLIPLLSLIKGQKLKRIIEGAIQECVGADADIEDTWKNFFCVATNYSRTCELVISRGKLAKSVRASVSIPGALPPVIHNGDLLVDGGTFNNFPTDVMARMGVGKMIGVDLMQEQLRETKLEEVPGTWALLRNSLRKTEHKKFWLPSLTSTLLNVTLLYSASRQKAAREMIDLCFHPDLRHVGTLQWGEFDRAVEIGYRHAIDVLSGMTAEQLAPYLSPQPE